MKMQSWIKKFVVLLVLVQGVGVSLSFAYETDTQELANEAELYVDGGVKALGQRKGSVAITSVGGTHCNRLKKLDDAVSAPLHAESIKNSRASAAR